MLNSRGVMAQPCLVPWLTLSKLKMVPSLRIQPVMLIILLGHPTYNTKHLPYLCIPMKSKAFVRSWIVSFAAVIRVVTQCSSPTNGCSLELYIPFLKLTNKDQASISWKPGPLAANVTRNMIGAAASSYMHVVGSQ